MHDTVATLNDPVAQDRMAETITAIVGALMQMQVGPLARAVAEIDPASDAAYIPPDATLGEMTGREPEYGERSDEHTPELQSLMRSSYAVFCSEQKRCGGKQKNNELKPNQQQVHTKL